MGNSLQLLLFIASIALVGAQKNLNSTSTSPTTATSTTPSSRTTTTQSPPAPAPVVPTWTVKSSNSTCIIMRGNFSFAVTYTTPTGNSVSSKVDIPANAKTSGSCGPFLNSLALTWSQGNLTFVFIKKPIYDAGVDTGNGSYSLTTIFGRITVVNSNDQNGTNNGMDGGNSNSTPPGSASSEQMFYISLKNPELMTASLHNSYACESYQSLAADKTGSVYLEMRNVQFEAFHDTTAAEFSPSQPCTKDTMSSVLAILGYSALAAIVLAILGYLAWRKFGRAGYTEV